MSDMPLEQRRKLLCATAASGELWNLEFAVEVVGCPLGPDVFAAARADNVGVVLGWLRRAGLTDTDESLEAAGRRGHPNCSPCCIIAAAGAGHAVCSRLRSINMLEERMNIALAAAAAAAGGGHAAECDRLLQLHKEMRDGFLGTNPTAAMLVEEEENFPQMQAAGLRVLEGAVEGVMALDELRALYAKWFDRRGQGRDGGGDGGHGGRGVRAEGGVGAGADSGSGGSGGGAEVVVYRHSGWRLTWPPEEEEEARLAAGMSPEQRRAVAAWRAGMDARLLAAAAGSASPQWRAKYEWLKACGHVIRRDSDKARVAVRAAACTTSGGSGSASGREGGRAVERLRYLRGELGVAAVCSVRVVAEMVANGNVEALAHVLALAAEAAGNEAATAAAAMAASAAGRAAEAAGGQAAMGAAGGGLGAGLHSGTSGSSSAAQGISSSSSSSRSLSLRCCTPCPSPKELVASVLAACDAAQTAAARGHLRCLQVIRAAGGRMSTAILVAALRAGQVPVAMWLLDECCSSSSSNSCPGSSGSCGNARSGKADDARNQAEEECEDAESQAQHEVKLTAAVCAAAARSGRLELLALVRARGCPWDETAVVAGAEAGCEAVLAYLVAEGCPAGDGHDAYAAAMAAEDVHTLRCLRRLGLPWAGDAATWRAHAIRCGVPLLRWLHEEAQVPVLAWMTSIGAARRGRRSEVLAMKVLKWYLRETTKNAEVQRQRLRQEEEERLRREQKRKWWRRTAAPQSSPLAGAGVAAVADSVVQLSGQKALTWMRERLAKGWRLGR
ncbi:hypothetical protein HYH02_005162 [Chlamydomonas schloesseri]|uniref:Ankyrin repeat domain-containing protein n=1 Tax=Chlamydomonas schloesseri TaxID=2026947 RepID=A0A835WLX3_9CHLO|nr:hypothetical protein HYH02_005162 [Chlamydomonas schloesseri]|eukprot:KAG2449629.1 hypothetical protein HYH02_005162 [Chlamydomonas schloesseri]